VSIKVERILKRSKLFFIVYRLFFYQLKIISTGITAFAKKPEFFKATNRVDGIWQATDALSDM